MSLKPAKNRHLVSYERKNGEGQKANNLKTGIPCYTFITSYKLILPNNISALNAIGIFIQRQNEFNDLIAAYPLPSHYDVGSLAPSQISETQSYLSVKQRSNVA